MTGQKFLMNGFLWKVQYVKPESDYLTDRTGTLRVATTDPKTQCIYLSNTLKGEFLTRVLLHELGHCVMFSYGLVKQIHTMTKPKYWIEMEEWVCNFIADYGWKIFSTAKTVLGDDVWVYMPYELERLIA